MILPIQICKDCGCVKLSTDFYFKDKKHIKIDTRCKNCHNKRTIERLNNNKKHFVELKGSYCAVCGMQFNDTNYKIAQFHHILGEKDNDISYLRRLKPEKVYDELAKTILVCPRCHRNIHKPTLSHDILDVKMRMFNYLGNVCNITGEVVTKETQHLFDFHHKNPKNKSFGMDLCSINGKTLDEIYKELDKCIIIECNAHAQLHGE